MEATTFESKVNYHIRTEQFEGPLDLLLQLIEKRKLFISDFSLAQVTDEYIARIRGFDAFPVSDVVNFLIVASALVLLKSRSLLPELPLTEEEGESIDQLKLRLALYEYFRNLAQVVKQSYGKHVLYERIYRPQKIMMFAPDRHLSVEFLRGQLDSVIAALPKADTLPKATIKKVVSLEEMLEKLTERIQSTLKMSFRDFTRYDNASSLPREERAEIIVGFLALLELVKQGILHATQETDYGDIHMENFNIGTPAYL